MSAVTAAPDPDEAPPPLDDHSALLNQEPTPLDDHSALLNQEPPPPPFSTIPLPSVPQSGETDAPSSPPLSAPLSALPGGSGLLDSATVQRMIDRLVALHFLASAADGQNPDTLVQAIRDFQSSAGISPTGTLDRDTIGRLTTP